MLYVCRMDQNGSTPALRDCCASWQIIVNLPFAFSWLVISHPMVFPSISNEQFFMVKPTVLKPHSTHYFQIFPMNCPVLKVNSFRLEQKTSQFLLRRTMENVNFGLPARVEVGLCGKYSFLKQDMTLIEMGVSQTWGYPQVTIFFFSPLNSDRIKTIVWPIDLDDLGYTGLRKIPNGPSF